VRSQRPLIDALASGDAQVEVDGRHGHTCAVYCIEHLGGYLVLSAGKKNVYRLDRSDLVHGFEGRRVVVTGCSRFQA